MDKQWNRIRCIAVDDEHLALDQMEAYISKVDFLHLMATFDNGSEALAFLKSNQVDILLLDVEMEDLTGIQLLEILDNKPFVILTTAYESYALKGYELDVTDYLLKPISYQRFLKAVTKVYDKINEQKRPVAEDKKKPEAGGDFVFVRTKRQLMKIFFQDVQYMEGMSNYLIIKLTGEKVYTLMSFKEMENILPAHSFVRIHKSFVVALDKIDRITKSHVHIGEKNIPIGQTYKMSFFRELEKRKLMK